MALTSSLLENPNLKVLDVQDNLLTPHGAEALAKVLPKLKNLKHLNIADCLIKSRGALAIAEALENHKSLEHFDVSYNEINGENGLKLTYSLCNKANLKEYNINGNRFGLETIEIITKTLKESNKDKTLGSFSGDEGECTSDEEGDNEEAEGSSSEEDKSSISCADDTAYLIKNMTVGEVKITENNSSDVNFAQLVDQLMDTAGQYNSSYDKTTLDKCFELYKSAYSRAIKTLKFVELTNLVLVKHGLIKNEDKNFQLRKDVGRCLEVLKKAVENTDIIPEPSNCILSFMLKKKFSVQ